ncbi:hypothetical protein GCM10007866_13950 [Gluconobacter albidus]|uniref:HTH cro/C1-type domain-containing protein n=1 Tax=Gluconobacter albidus TaxID=318683 RepID=A0ABQ5WZR6_9PROT|nr:hypothetical protein GCM10007866_13950 [Gluconobacter albidus]
MKNLPSPADIESDARERGIAIGDLCRRAQVARSTFTRWKAGETSPTLAVVGRLIQALQECGEVEKAA